MKPKRLFLIDGAGYYYRAFYGIRQRLTAPDGTPTNAVFGVANMFSRIIKDEKPDLLAIALDSPEKNFRHDLYPQYKENRQRMPEELSLQIPLIERLIRCFNLHILKKSGMEADDLIGAAAVKGAKLGYDVTIVSGDKDLMQLVGRGIKMFDPLKDAWYDESGVVEKMGVPPERITDLLGLMGDASDNIPGVPGVGEKTARALLEKYSTLDDVLSRAKEIERPKLRQSLIENAELARLSRKLATISEESGRDMNPASWVVEPPDSAGLARLYKELGFKTLLEETAVAAKKGAKREVNVVLSAKDLESLVSRLRASGGFAFDTETTSVEPMRASLVGVSVSLKEGEAFYVPLAHDYDGAPEQMPKKTALDLLRTALEDEKVEKYGQNMKYDMIVLANEGVGVRPASFDTMIASYVTAAEERRHNLSHLAEKFLGRTMREYSDIAGKGAKEVPFNKVGITEAADYSCDDAETTLALTAVLREEIKNFGVEDLYYKLEMPLVGVLARMERNGILLDAKRLTNYSARLDKQLSTMEGEVYAAAGEEFNISSPRQLSTVLFDKLGLPKVRKTKTGQSTDQDVLETLAAMGHPLPRLVLRHRTLSKLKSTYVDPMPHMILPSTGRIHTSFNQTGAATGRLSSSDPNLQNIPVRTEEGREIRRAFRAGRGNLLLSADYSQMELRVLAHMSGDALLLESFKRGEDVHHRTAREIFGANGEPTPEMRRVAKAVNFGIIYGQTAFGLSRELGIGRGEAQGYIENYFARYGGVKKFIAATIASARAEKGVTTLMGRRRLLPTITSSNRTVRETAERMAVNTVLQGTAADLIKKAMLDIDSKIEGTDVKMLLQIHDELIFECPEKSRAAAVELVRGAMESVAKLRAPLKVAVGWADNWGDI